MIEQSDQPLTPTVSAHLVALKTVFDTLDAVRRSTAQSHDKLAAKHKLEAGVAPIGAFNMINQFVLIAMEMISHYATEWESVAPEAMDDRRKLECAERIITVTKSCFILAMSAIEFSAKSAVMIRPGPLKPGRGRIYLSRIMDSSRHVGLISESDAELWEGLVTVRNTVVHNNAIADKDAAYSIGSGDEIKLQAGKMTQGRLGFFSHLIVASVAGFGRWCDAYLR
jgi:hypothetical protein